MENPYTKYTKWTFQKHGKITPPHTSHTATHRAHQRRGISYMPWLAYCFAPWGIKQIRWKNFLAV